MLKINNIVRSKKQGDSIIPYLIIEIKNKDAKCINLINTFNYTIPLDDLYLWIMWDV